MARNLASSNAPMHRSEQEQGSPKTNAVYPPTFYRYLLVPFITAVPLNARAGLNGSF